MQSAIRYNIFQLRFIFVDNTVGLTEVTCFETTDYTVPLHILIAMANSNTGHLPTQAVHIVSKLYETFLAVMVQFLLKFFKNAL